MSLWQKFRCLIGSHGSVDGTARPSVNGEGIEVVSIVIFCPHCKEPLARIDVGHLPPLPLDLTEPTNGWYH